MPLKSLQTTLNRKTKCVKCGRARFFDSNWCQSCYRIHYGLPAVFARVKEMAIRDFLQAFMAKHFEIRVHWNKTLGRGKKHRPDLFFTFLNRALVCVEIDEGSHRTYSGTSEDARIAELLRACTLPLLVVLRINPDKWSGGPHIWTRVKRLVDVNLIEDIVHVNDEELHKRLDVLGKCLKDLLKDIAIQISPEAFFSPAPSLQKQIQIHRLFYDE